MLLYDRAFVSGSFRRSWRDHRGLYLGLASTWLLLLWLSPLWLERFRYGPLEWLWRSLSYWRRQPWRSAAA